MRPVLFLHHPAPPFPPLRELRTAVNVDRVHPLDEPGQMSFQLSEVEGATAPAALEIKEGMAVVDRSTEDVDPWLWYITRVGFDIETGMVDVECQEWRALLDARIVPLDTLAGSRAAFRVALRLLAAVGARNPTHIIPDFSSMSGLRFTLPGLGQAQEQPLGGLTIRSALDQIALQTETEWWIHYDVTWSSVRPMIQWGHRRGVDRSYYVHLQEGYHLSQGSYSRDGSGQGNLMQFVGGGGAANERPAGSQAVGAAIAVQRPSAGGRVVEAPESDRRRSLRFSGPAVSAEVLNVSPSVEDESALVTSSLRDLTIPISALEQVEAMIASRVDWSQILLGDTILLRFASARLRQGVDVPARVVALQPDEAEGEMDIALEVQA